MDHALNHLTPPSRALPDCAAHRLGAYFTACERHESPTAGRLTTDQPLAQGDGLLIQYGDAGDLGRQEVIRFGDGFGLVSSHLNVPAPYVGRTHGEDWLTLQFRLAGVSTEVFGDKGETTGRESHCHVVVLPDGVDQGCWIDEGVEWRTVLLALHLDQARSIMTDLSAGLPDTLRGILCDPSAAEFYFQSLPLSQSMARAALDLVRSPYAGKTRKIYAQAKAMELLCLTFDNMKRALAAAGTTPAVVLSARDIAKLHDARERIASDLAAPISNKQLARLVGLNETKLTRGFREVFGRTLSDYVQDCRMREAHVLLTQDRLSVLETAHRVGYAHVSSFSKAFRRSFGVSAREYVSASRH